MIRIHPLPLCVFLATITIALSLASLLAIYLGIVTIEDRTFAELSKIYIRLFDLNREANIPTWFSSFLLILNAFILAIVAIPTKARQGPYFAQWFVLAVLFVYRSIDEGALLHEMLEKPTRRAFHVSGYLYFAWIIPAVGFLIVLAVYIRRFLFHLPRYTRWLFLIAGGIYVAGAVGMEMIGSNIYYTHGGHKPVSYYLWATLEETFEMLGLIIFFYALLDYAARYTPEIVFTIQRGRSSSALSD